MILGCPVADGHPKKGWVGRAIAKLITNLSDKKTTSGRSATRTSLRKVLARGAGLERLLFYGPLTLRLRVSADTRVVVSSC